mgnify:FL=1
MTYIDSPEFHDPAAHVVAYIEWRRAKVRQMAEDNVRLVGFMVNKWVARTGRKDLREEAVSQGNVTLMKCAHLFDESRGFKFPTYACRAIEQNLWRLIDELDRGNRIGNMKRVRGRANDQGELHCPLETAPDRDSTAQDKADDFDYLNYLLRFVDEGRRNVVAVRFLAGNTLETTAWTFGISKGRVDQIGDEAIEVMRRAARRERTIGIGGGGRDWDAFGCMKCPGETCNLSRVCSRCIREAEARQAA